MVHLLGFVGYIKKTKCADERLVGDTDRILAALRTELENINEAIRSIERLAGSVGPRRRGRPPGSKNKPKPPETTKATLSLLPLTK